MRFSRLVEDRIRRAQEEGKFRALRGEGAPQDLEENPFEDPEMRVPFKILSNAGFCPPWIELMKEIDADIALARRIQEDYRSARCRQVYRIGRMGVLRFAEMVADLDAARNRTLQRLEQQWRQINTKIAHFNATVPVEGLKKLPLRVDRERERFEREFPLLAGKLAGR